MLEDAGIDFKYVRYTFPQWLEQKQKLLAEKIRAPTMPYITVDGKYYGKTVPVMKYITQKLGGQYEGRNEDEVQLLDAYTDSIMDWMNNYVTYAFRDGDADTYLNKQAPEAYKTFNDILSDVKGPYILGDYISYADFLLYHVIEEEPTEVTAENYPHVYEFIQAIENRPNLKKYLATDRS